MVIDREYGVATEIYVAVPKVNDTDLAATADYAYVAGDIKISKDGGAAANISGTPTEVDMGTFMVLSIPLTATEMQAETVIVALADAALEHNVWIIETYGNASARHPVYPADMVEINGDANAAAVLALMTGTDITATAQAGAAGTITLAAGASATDDAYNYWWVTIISGTGALQRRYIVDYNGTTKVASVSPNWATNPASDSVYVLTLGAPGPTTVTALPDVNVAAWLGTAVATPTVAGVPEVDVTHVAGVAEDIATATAVTNLDTDVQSALADIATVDGKVVVVDGIVDAIKAKTDSLTFTKANELDSNVQSINDVTITGNGGTGTEFGV